MSRRCKIGGLTALFFAIPVAAQDGAALFQKNCASCHESSDRAPSREVLSQRAPEGILQALSAGTMRPQGSHLSGAERRAVAEYVTGKKLSGDVTGSAQGRCESAKPLDKTAAWPAWGLTQTNTRYQTNPGLTADQVPKLALKWALGFPDATSAWSQPIVAGGRVFVGSHNGTVYSLDAKSGCIYWTFSAKGAVRSAVVISGSTVYFGDNSAMAYALDAATGKELWRREVESHPYARISGSPAIYDGKVIVGVASFEETVGTNPGYKCCTFRGSLNALDSKTGAIVWRTFLVPEPKQQTTSKGQTFWGPSGAGIWSAPTIDTKRGLIYAATGNTYTAPQLDTSDAIVAFDLKTGKIKWTKQVTPKDVFMGGCRPNTTNPVCPEENGPDFDFGQPPILTKLPNGKEVLIAGQKSGVGYALDPEKEGALLWQYRAGEGSALGGLEWGSAVDETKVYFPVSDIIKPKPGGLHAVNLATGERVWFTPPPDPKCGTGRGCNAAQTAAITVIPGVVFSGSNDGALRAYSTSDGKIIWEYDTNREFKTVNGVPAKGASMHSGGPAVANGMVYVNSGYGDHGGRPGNVLLAFGLE
jgi:polyvinyl alcohol dehydrogenase (cytochrome)